jgi:tripartite motif-containing protein 71
MLSRTLIAAVTMLLTFASNADAVDLLYVSMRSTGSADSIRTYNSSGNIGTTIASTNTAFANTNLASPSEMVFDSSGNLYVANGGGSIAKFNSSGSYLSSIMTSNTAWPLGLAIDSYSNLYTSNYLANTISKYNSSGVLQSTIGSSLYLSSPWGLAIDSSGNLYAANNNTTLTDIYISKFDSSGIFQSSGSIYRYFTYPNPTGLTFDSDGNFYITSRGNYISKHTSTGKWVWDVSDWTGSKLNSPSDLAIDSSGNIFVANSGNNTISKFGSTGNFITSWSTGTLSPRGLAFRPVSVPEPSTYILATIAASTLAYVAHRRKK